MVTSRFPVPASCIRSVYYAVQGTGTLIWLWWLVADGSRARSFIAASQNDETLVAFFPSDVVFASASFAAALFAFRRHEWERPAAWFAAGCAIYATLWCAGVWWQTGEAAAAVAIMSPCALASTACALWAHRS